jgi:hypothetical protein
MAHDRRWLNHVHLRTAAWNALFAQGATSVRPPVAQTDGKTDASSPQAPEPKGQNASICPSVPSVQERTDNASPETVGALCVLAQTDRTDRQMEIESTEPANKFGLGHLSDDLSSRQGQADGRQSATKSYEKGDDLLGIPPFLGVPFRRWRPKVHLRWSCRAIVSMTWRLAARRYYERGA